MQPRILVGTSSKKFRPTIAHRDRIVQVGSNFAPLFKSCFARVHVSKNTHTHTRVCVFCVCLGTCTNIHAYIGTYVHAHILAFIHAHMHTYMRTYTHTHRCCIRVCKCVCVCVCENAQTQQHTNAQTLKRT